MTLPIPSAVPADVAERIHDRDEARREAVMPDYQTALDDLFDKLMDGEEYPRRGSRSQINRYHILIDDSVDKSELAELVNMFMSATLAGEDAARQRVKKIVRRYLDGEGRAWTEMRREEMSQEAEESNDG